MKKKCVDCGKTKEISAFARRINYYESGKIYYWSYCRVCKGKRRTAWKVKNAERNREYMRNWYQKKKKAAHITSK